MKNKLNEAIYFAYYGGLLNAHQREIMHLYYDLDMSLAEISEEKNITRQAVHDVIIRSNEKLCQCENKLGIVSKIMHVVASVEDMLSKQDLNECHKSDLENVLTEIKEI